MGCRVKPVGRNGDDGGTVDVIVDVDVLVHGSRFAAAVRLHCDFCIPGEGLAIVRFGRGQEAALGGS